MTKEEFKKLSDLASQWYAENMVNYLKEYDWDKFVMVADYSTMFGSKRNKYDLYKNGIKITPYINEKGEYKSNETESAKKIDEKYIQMGMSTVDLRTLTNDDTKYNIWEFTLYPSGEYKSNFIWENNAYLEKLAKSVRTWLSSIYQYACERIQDRCSQLSIDIPNEVEMNVSFNKLGVSQPVVFSTKDASQMNFKLHLEQIYDYCERPYEEEFAEYDAVRKHTEGDVISEGMQNYQKTNEGELKGYYPRWNKLIFNLNPKDQYSFSYEKLKFEWVEENA